MNEKETLMEFSTRIFDLANQMNSHGEDVTNQRLVHKILICLPEKYDTIVAVIEETKDLSTLTVQEVMASLKSFEQRLSRHSEKSIESAFQSKLSTGSSKREESPSSNQQRGGRKSRGRGGQNSKGKKKDNATYCSNCNKPNHTEEECWYKGQSRCYKCNRFVHLAKRLPSWKQSSS